MRLFDSIRPNPLVVTVRRGINLGGVEPIIRAVFSAEGLKLLAPNTSLAERSRGMIDLTQYCMAQNSPDRIALRCNLVERRD